MTVDWERLDDTARNLLRLALSGSSNKAPVFISVFVRYIS